MPIPYEKEKPKHPKITRQFAEAEARRLVEEYNPEHLDGRARAQRLAEPGVDAVGEEGYPSIALLDVCAVLIFNRGNVYRSAVQLGTSRFTMYSMKNKYKCVEEAIKTGREIRLDIWENQLDERIDEGKDFIPLIFGLKTLGKSRGYVENQVVYNRINVQQLTIQQLERLAAGEEPASVLGDQVITQALKAPKDEDIIDVEAKDV